MHREYRPEDLNRLRARAFGAGEGHDHHHHDHGHGHHHHAHDHEPHEHDERSLYFLTALMGLLLSSDLVFGWLGGMRPPPRSACR
ncbi:MAG: hypothetical protein U0835_11515 [Isosphaeraceae bacterium]